MAIPIIQPTLDPVTSESFEVTGDRLPATVIVNGMSPTEEIGVEINNGFGWEAIRFGATDFKITYETAHTTVIQSRARLRIVKPATLNPVGVGLSVKDNV